MKVSLAVAQAFVCGALLGLQCPSMAQAPTPKSPAQPCEKQKEERVDTNTDPAADTASKKPSTATSSSSEAAKPKREEKSESGADEADTLGKPPA